jgi:nucleotide-binding universal stress UspA family protein
MTYKTLLVPALNEGQMAASLETALPIARTFQAHIAVVHPVEPVPTVTVADMNWHPEYISSHKAATARLAQLLGDRFADFCDRHDVPRTDIEDPTGTPNCRASWTTTEGFAGDRLSTIARATDLVVMGSRDSLAHDWTTGVVEEILGRSARGVLLTRTPVPTGLPERIVVAWNGSQEVARAVSLAEPFLREARSVSVISIGKIDPALPSVERVSAMLQRKGIHASSLALDDVKAGTTDQILCEADSRQADLIVLGAYSHARWREAIVGGVTKTILKETTIPVFMAH